MVQQACLAKKTILFVIKMQTYILSLKYVNVNGFVAKHVLEK